MPTTGPFAGFNPYEEDRFKWIEYSWKDIYLFLDNYKTFFNIIKSKSSHKKLREYIEFNEKLKSSITIENI